MGKLIRTIQNIAKRFYDVTDDYWYSAVSTPAISGVDVTETSALKLPTVWACVRVISETIASLPLFVYRRLDNGGKERATEHPLYNLLHLRPNYEMSSFQFREIIMEHLLLWGNFYGLIDQARNGVISNIWILSPDRMSVYREDNGNGNLFYIYKPYHVGEHGAEGSKMTVRYEADEILHIPGIGFNGVVGYSPITMARDSIGLGMAAEEMANRFFGNDATPGMLLKHPGRLTKDAHDRLQSSWIEAHSGLKNKWKPAILEEGMTAETMTMPLKDAQFLETRKFQVLDICRIFNVPPYKIMDFDRATFSNVEQTAIDWVVHCIRPWLVRIEQILILKLFSDQAQRTYFCEHLVDGLLRGDVQTRFAAYAQGRQWGWLSANDVRSYENMNPIDGGDVYLVPLNMVPADKVEEIAANQVNPPPKQIEEKPKEEKPMMSQEEMDKVKIEEDSLKLEIEKRKSENELLTKQIDLMKKDGFKRIFEDAVGRVIRREYVAVKKALQRKDVQGFENHLQGFYQELPEFMATTIHPSLASYAQFLNSTQELDCLKGYIENHIAESKNEIAKWNGVYIHDSTDATFRKNDQEIEDCMNLWMEKRPEMAANCFMTFFSTS